MRAYSCPCTHARTRHCRIRLRCVLTARCPAQFTIAGAMRDCAATLTAEPATRDGHPAGDRTRRNYPCDLAEKVEHDGRCVMLRPIRWDDTELHRAFLARIGPEDLRLRFFAGVRELPEAELQRFTHIDYDREMAFVATSRTSGGEEEILGVVRACIESAQSRAEFALLVRSDLKRRGFGRLLMMKLIRYCRTRGILELRGNILGENLPMMQLARSLGFHILRNEGNVEEWVLGLTASEASGCKFRAAGSVAGP
jgi:GNAT superfamily N-acetyltransferase